MTARRTKGASRTAKKHQEGNLFQDGVETIAPVAVAEGDKPKPGRRGRPKKNMATKPESDLISLKDNNKIYVQPVSAALMRQGFTAIQNKVFTCLFGKLQAELHQMISKNEKEFRFEDIQSKDVTFSDGLSFKMKFNEFGVSRNNYHDLKKALITLTGYTVEIPYKGPRGKEFLRYTNFCDVFIDTKAYTKYCIIGMKKDVAKALLSLGMGFQSIYKVVLLNNCKSSYSQRLYMLINAWKSKGTFRMKTEEFRKMLRIENKYPAFRHVKARVLDPARDELKSLCQGNFCDCYFEYEPIYPNGHKRGEPDMIEFIVHAKDVSLSEEAQQTLNGQQVNFKNIVVNHFNYPEKEATALSKQITMANYSVFLDKALDLNNYLQDNHVKNTYLYAKKSFDNLIENLKADMVVDEEGNVIE